MKQSQFDAKTFGLGELISQRKLFRVPRHQRSFSWTPDLVDSLLTDIQTAFKAGASEYFVGLIVIQGPVDGEWTLLDGQQRLTSISLLYTAIRNWLRSNSFEEDARQIENEFLVVRRLGGDFSSRMLLNDENRQLFEQIVLGSDGSTGERPRAYAKRSSNRNLWDAFVNCERWVSLFCQEAGTPLQASSLLYKLANFVETRVKAVSVEVSSDVDAYILFEALNDRGVELSAFDLLKNYLYSKVTESHIPALEADWKETVENLEEVNPDDFLKVFWTSRHGIIQKALLFKALREKYSGEESAIQLIDDLRTDSVLISAVDDPRDPHWNSFPESVRTHIAILNILGSKQARPVVLAAIHKLAMPLFDALLWHIVVAIVRYQIVGRGRTGVVERVFGRLCKSISDGVLATENQILAILGELTVTDMDFKTGFEFHSESKLSRYYYFLWELERYAASAETEEFQVSLEEITEKFALWAYSEPKALNQEDRAAGLANRIGNFALIERSKWSDPRPASHDLTSAALATSSLELTRNTATDVMYMHTARSFVEERSAQFAILASQVWTHTPVLPLGEE